MQATGKFASRRLLPACLAVVLGLSLSLPALAQTVYAFEDEDEKGPWQEGEVRFPPAPAESDLLEFDVGSGASQVFAVDGKSISVGADGVVRYTVVAKSRAGARSISYEGIRCKTFERRVYAFGQKDGSWIQSRRSSWERIPRGARNGVGEALALDYFCEGVTIAGTAQDMTKRIRTRQVLNPRIQY